MLKFPKDTVGTSSDTDDVQKTLTNIQRLLAFSGLSWDYQQPKPAKRFTVLLVASRIYSSLVCISIIISVIQIIPLYSKAESFLETSLPLVNNILTLLCLTFWSLSTNIHSKVRIFCQRLNDARLKFNSCVSTITLRRRVKVACVSIVILAAGACVGSGFSTSMMSEASSEFYWPSVVLSLIASGYVTLLVHALLLLFLSITLLLTNEYDGCMLRLLRASEGSVKEEDIEDIRGYHASLTDIVEHVSSLMSRYVAAGYVSSFLVVCFCLYSIINDDKSFVNLSITGGTVYMSTLHLVTLTYIGIRLNEAAHRPLNILHDLAGRNMPDRVIGLVTLFANKLSQRQIGINALGLMTITKDTILTVIGTLLTYVFIVIQFKPESPGGCRQDANTTAI